MMNRVVVVGRLVKDPELKKTNNGSSVVSFTLAVDNRQRSNGEKVGKLSSRALHGMQRLKMSLAL
jgi:single-stranded DNA-binding protein